MKHILLIVSLLVGSIVSAQIEWEHTYFYTTVTRIVLENSGEKYYSVNRPLGRIEFFNADHSFWKNVPISVPAQTYSIVVRHISETTINADSNIEISYTAFSSAAEPQSSIVNDLGTVLLSEDNCSALTVDIKDGLASKVISANGGVYAVPALSLEHTFSIGDAKRVKLENSGEKYYLLDKPNSVVNFYNSDYSFWKSVPASIPQTASYAWVNFVSDHQVNEDDFIELAYSYFSNAVAVSKVVNENGDTLFTAADTNGIQVSVIDGLTNKLMVYKADNGTSPTTYTTEIRNIDDFSLEHTYQGQMTRAKLENSGEKYYIVNNNHNTNSVIIYNSDHTPWKTFDIALQNPDETIIGVWPSETKIDPDSQVELFYTISSNTLDGGHYSSYIVKEDGEELLSVPGAYALYLSEFPGVTSKIIANTQDGDFPMLQYASIIYTFEGVFALQDFDKTAVKMVPNPANDAVRLTSETLIVKVEVFDARGVAVSQFSAAAIEKINVGNLANGLYLFRLTDANGNASVKKIAVMH